MPASSAGQGGLVILHNFTGTPADGGDPNTLLHGPDGNFYGTTVRGGAFDLGTVFRLTPSGAVTLLHSFAGGTADGASPQAALIQTADGSFFGTTRLGGASNLGTIFRLDDAGLITLLHSFTGGGVGGGSDGGYPVTSLIQATDGNLYGTTSAGGAFDLGTVYRMTPGGHVTVLHALTGGPDGSRPSALIQASDGHFYATTAGAANQNVFRITSTGVLTVLHTFGGPGSAASLIQASDGNLYGTTVRASVDVYPFGGMIFKITLDGTFSTVTTNVEGGSDFPLIQWVDGSFYGVHGFPSNPGYQIFRATLAGGFVTVLSPLHALPYKAQPIILGHDGGLYGTAHGFNWSGRTGSGYAPGFAFRFSIPPAPTGLTATASYSGVRLTWAAAPNATSYTVKRGSMAGGETPIATGITATSYIDTTATTQGSTYYYVVSAVNALGESPNSNETVVVSPARAADYDIDGRVDLVVFRPANSTWYTRLSGDNFANGTSVQFGLNGDQPVPGDYDGDGRHDVAVYRPVNGTWYFAASSNGTTHTLVLGAAADIAVPGDYDADGRTDPAVYRPSTGIWYFTRSSSGYAVIPVALGLSSDIPVPGDYDGDGRTDVAVYRAQTGRWYVRLSSTGFATASIFGWGLAGDIPAPADYDGDGKTDPTVFRPSAGAWYILQSSTGHSTSRGFALGTDSSIPVPGDYDGDRKADAAVYDSGAWLILDSSSNFTTTRTYSWGLAGDRPMPNVIVTNARVMAAAAPSSSPLANMSRFGDFNADGAADVTVYRPSTSEWFTLHSTTNYKTASVISWGLSGDIPAAADFDGDGKTNHAIFRPSTGQWFVLNSFDLTSTMVLGWGVPGDVPVPGDYDGDGRADAAVYSPATACGGFGSRERTSLHLRGTSGGSAVTSPCRPTTMATAVWTSRSIGPPRASGSFFSRAASIRRASSEDGGSRMTSRSRATTTATVKATRPSTAPRQASGGWFSRVTAPASRQDRGDYLATSRYLPITTSMAGRILLSIDRRRVSGSSSGRRHGPASRIHGASVETRQS